ncbi:transposable element Tc3 transposase [Trichonephila clavipes]|nr:transposable element Tc3 transposase [Trichonephila clavipes]
MDWPVRSPDLNPIEHVWDDFLGRRLAARTLPPVMIRELRLALQDEWVAMPQQLIDTLILSMGRRCETCLTSYDMATIDFLHHDNPPTWAGVEPATLVARDNQTVQRSVLNPLADVFGGPGGSNCVVPPQGENEENKSFVATSFLKNKTRTVLLSSVQCFLRDKYGLFT